MGQSVMVSGGGGKWILKGSGFWDTERGAWVKKCRVCKKLYYAYRTDSDTCGDACRQRKKRSAKP